MFCTPSHADIYKYTDQKGVTHFTNTPEGKGYTKVITEYKAPSERKYDRIIDQTSLKYNIEPAVIKAVITAESDWNPAAVSHKGAIGLMQLMPGTARDMQVSNPYDPEENIEGGTKYLRWLLNRFNGNLDLALAAYNAGPSKVERSGGIPSIRETSKYVKNVTRIYKGTSEGKNSKIYKVTYDDGTVLYTNTNSRN
jgi:soluble lytic murein transglycosylase